ncbi:extracellular solute-binding protein [Kineococcus siccus]|uniref:extracellular solute-binding protein n=1 Tax=Kineococcus siccus TaxID=2696567 RepID=UPI001F0D9FA2|nr:extracellular solute-binding protein [Kineococcus siccus]
MTRRSLLGLVGTGVVAIGLPAGLSSCSSGQAAAPPPTGALSSAELAKVIPSYLPREVVPPDIPSVDGSTPGFTTMPAELVTSVPTPPGSGGKYTAMSPAWWAVPPGLAKNSYYQAVNEALGTTIDFQVSDGSAYADKLQAVLASPKDVPDWVVMPSWNIPTRFQQGVGALFTDLTDHLAGDKVKKYPNLAALPSEAWKFCVFNGRLYALPFPGGSLNAAIFYRKDLFDSLGLAMPTSLEEFTEVAKAATDPSKNRWGLEDPWDNGSPFLFRNGADWFLRDGKLVSRFETEEYRQSLEWTASLFAAGVVHPDSVAGDQSGSKDRFESGQSLIAADGAGGWPEALARVRPSNPTYDQQPIDFFPVDGEQPWIPRVAPANIFSFLKKTDDEAKIAEMLAVADFIAAPFGTTEQVLVNYGVEGQHFTRDAAGAPELTDLGQREVTTTYGFLVGAPVANARVQFPDYVRDSTAYEQRMAPFMADPVFYGQQIQDPPEYSSLGKPFVDLAKDICRGRKGMKDLDAAVKTWRDSGGDELRAYREGFLTGDEPANT